MMPYFDPSSLLLSPVDPQLPGNSGDESQRQPLSHQRLGAILIVEDDEDIRETLADILQYEGYPVSRAGHGQEALEYLRQHPAPALILLDLMMPVMSGWEFRTVQLQDATLAPIPVIVLSGIQDLGQQAAFLSVAACLPKPVEVVQLLTLVRRFCG